MFSNNMTVRNVRMPWIDRGSSNTYAQLIVDDVLPFMLDPGPSRPYDTSTPILDACDDEFIANLDATFKSQDAHMKRILIVSNMVYGCMTTTRFFENQILLSDYLQKSNTVIDYVYYNSRRYEQNFTNSNISRALSGAFPVSPNSSSHIYYTRSIDELNAAIEQISFCADEMIASAIVESIPIAVSKANNSTTRLS